MNIGIGGGKLIRINKGYITVEACVVVPLFLFFMLAVGRLVMLMFAEAHIHQSLAEAANYTAGYCYLEEKLSAGTQTEGLINLAILTKQFRTYLGDDPYVEQTIKNGKTGIILSIKHDADNKKIFTVKAVFFASIQIPVLGNYYVRMTDVIKEKAFIGYERGENKDRYVYVTPNESVYHSRRSCSHLSLSVSEIREGQKGDYSPCGFCGKDNSVSGKFYIAKTGNVYHSRSDCSGLKRTIRRVSIENVGGLGPCQRCGR